MLEVVRGILISPVRQALVCLRPHDVFEGNKWCLVGGKAVTSDWEKELRREAGEEVGINLGRLYFYARIQQASAQQHYYSTEITNNQVAIAEIFFNRREIQAIALMGLGDIQRSTFAFGDGVVLENFLKKL